MKAGEIVTVEAAELVAGGAALARLDGFPIFVSGLFPGDVASVRLFEVKKGFARGEVDELITRSPLRRVSPCSIAEECGGCDWTALRLDAQLQAKRRILTESLRRIGKIDPGSLPPIAVHPSPLNYRIRSRLHADGDAVGFYAMRSNRVVPLAPDCEVVGLRTRETPMEGETWEVDGKLVREGELSIDGYRVTTDSFFQVNRHLHGTMLRRVVEIASGVGGRRAAIDLYAGVGFFSAPLARVFDRVLSVEGSWQSHACARSNVPQNVQLINAPVETWVDSMPEADFVLLDPPRAGARRNVIDAVGEKARDRICFVACDPVTFARDASRLIASGWRLSTLEILDLFPNTHHVETLSSFERAT